MKAEALREAGIEVIPLSGIAAEAERRLKIRRAVYLQRLVKRLRQLLQRKSDACHPS